MEEDMLYTDLSNDYKKRTTGDIYSGVYVREQLFEFERVSLFQDKMSVMLPIVFQDMSLESAKVKYPNENRPQIIKMNKGGDVNFCFSLPDMNVKQEELCYLMTQMKSAIQKIQPANQFFESDTKSINLQTYSWFDFKSFTLEEPLYNLMIFSEVGGKFLHGIFNCKFSEMELWKNVMLQVMYSIQDNTKKS